MSKNWEVRARQKYTDYNENRKIQVIGYFCRAGTSQFLTRHLPVTNNTPPISHSPLLLAAGPIQNAKIMKSLLVID